jgi:hypothetical protein
LETNAEPAPLKGELDSGKDILATGTVLNLEFIHHPTNFGRDEMIEPE